MKKNTISKIFILGFLSFSQEKYSYAILKLDSIDPIEISGDESSSPKSTNEIADKISLLKSQSEEIKSKIIQLQDILISKYKDRFELIINIIPEAQKEEPTLGIIQFFATLNHVTIINYSKPIIFEKKPILPIFRGPLPIGSYELKIHAIVGQHNEHWPYVLPQGKWSIDKTIRINGDLSTPIQNLNVLLIMNSKTGIPEFKNSQVLENNK